MSTFYANSMALSKELAILLASSPLLDTLSSSDDASKIGASLKAVLQNPAKRKDLPASLSQKRNLPQSHQCNSLVSFNLSLASMESDPSTRAQFESPTAIMAESMNKDFRPMESIQPFVTQMYQPCDDSMIRISPTVIDDNNNHTSEMEKYVDRIQPPPLTWRKLREGAVGPKPVVRENSVSGDFPLNEPSTSPKVQSPPGVKPATKNFPNSFLLALATPVSTEVSEKVEPPKTSWRSTSRLSQSSQCIGESNKSSSLDDFSALSPDDVLARKMEELGRIRRIEVAQSKASVEVTSHRPSQTNRMIAAPRAELLPKLQTEDSSSDVAMLLREEQQQALQTRLDKALAELQDARAENKGLTNENQFQQRSTSQLKIAHDEVKRAQDRSLLEIKNQLRDATSSLNVLNEEKKEWQDKLDLMQHKLSLALTNEDQSQRRISKLNTALDKEKQAQENLLVQLRHAVLSSTVLKDERKGWQDKLDLMQHKLALAESPDLRAENKRLTNEVQSQQRSISQLNIALDQVRHAHDHSLTQIKDQLRDATLSLTVEKKGYQNKLDLMQHKLSAAERQLRCLDHLTRHKLESRQTAVYGQPKRGLLGFTPASTDVIGLMGVLNKEIHQTCAQLADGLESTSIFSAKYKSQAQKMLGDRLTAMMEDQGKMTPGYNMLLMQTVLEVFMTHWCSSIIEAFYPPQESFADLLVQLSTQTRTSGWGK